MEYATIESRLATFEPPTKRSKLGWPHKSPTARDLAFAGFYHKPTKSSNDNTVCYLCERQLGGWEADDDPVEEHFKHSPECGWAILMSVAQDTKQDTETMEDPTGQLLADARRATFAIGWPHESKRAWKCKTEKMVEAGWHFAPVAEGEDYVSCSYCKLSLDGWEPKDDPFEEHHRRSPECVFFHFAGHTAPVKRPKAKKGRPSKASRSSKASTRLSTQSSNTQDVTMISEAASVLLGDIPDLDDSIDASEMSSMSVASVMSTASTATTKGKRKGAVGRPKTTKAKKAKTTRSTKAKKEEPEPEIEAEPVHVIAETSALHEPEPVLVESDMAAAEPEFEARQQEPTLHPLPSPPAELNYPSIPHESTPPRISNTPRRLSPVAVQDNSPTPVKPRSMRSSLASVARTATPKPPPSTTKHHLQSAAASHAASSPRPQTQHATINSPTPSPSTSDIENAPPSARSPYSRPPPTTTLSPIALKPTTLSPLPPKLTTSSKPSPGHAMPTWTPSDIELIFNPNTPAKAENEILLALTASHISSPEKNMTVQEWIEFVALRAEEGLRSEGERVVGVFEREGQRAMGLLEGVRYPSEGIWSMLLFLVESWKAITDGDVVGNGSPDLFDAIRATLESLAAF